MTTKAAGVLYLAKDGSALFLKRGPGGGHPGEWCLPGGHVEEGETSEQAARREWEEETGFPFEGELELWARRKELDARNPFGYSETLEHEPAPGGAPVGPGQMPDVAQQAARDEPTMAPNAPEDVDFTTFIARGGEVFIPKVRGEHTGYAWAQPDLPPEPLHPGVRVALAKLTMNELDIAKAIAEGELTSPQQYENIWLFDLRVTGTDTAYRERYDEHAYRAPELYLTPEFLARCNGLPVIVEHPENRSILDSKEYADRVVGAVFVPYIKGQEVWGIAKIYDQKTAELMRDEQLSTSPSVVFRARSGNVKFEMEDGHTLLIEGKPSLLDHLAICAQGVWDKGGDPVGVVSADIRGDSSMPEVDKEKAEGLRGDAEAGEKLDKILSCLDSVGKRMDALSSRVDSIEHRKEDDDDDRKDAKRKDADPLENHEGGKGEPKPNEPKDDDDDDRKDARRKDSKRKDEEDEEGGVMPPEVVADRKKARKDDDDDRKDAKRKDDDDDDRARKDSGITPADRVLLDELKAARAAEPTENDRKAFADSQARADAVYQVHGDSAPRPMLGESVLAYRKRLASKFKSCSNEFKDVDLGVINDSALLSIAERNIFEAAKEAALHPVGLPSGVLREMVRVDSATGQRTVTFYGSGTFIGGLSRRGRKVTKFNLARKEA
jgi:8-oxo-dGTP pyrophosphatase MutT (NUDIX family)